MHLTTKLIGDFGQTRRLIVFGANPMRTIVEHHFWMTGRQFAGGHFGGGAGKV
jgi:hypothetical protein